MIRKTIPLIFLQITSLTGLAQEKLDTATVSATRLQTKLSHTGKAVTVITAREIALLPVNSVEDVLQNIAGVNLNARAGFGIQTDIGLRGSTFSQVLILIDNQRLNDGLTGHFNNNIPIALSEIERIEVIKGPAASSFGADAVGGVIHIKTKTYLAKPKYKLNFIGKVSKGQYGLNNNDLGLFMSTKKWAFSGGVRSLNADGQEFANPNFPANSGDSLYQTRFNQKNYTASGVYFKDHWKFYIRGAMDVRDFNAKYFYTASSLDESEEEVRAHWLQSAIIHQGKKLRTEFNIGYKQNRDTFNFNPTFPSINGHTTTRLNSTLGQNFRKGKARFAYGLQFDRTSIESTDRGNHSNFSLAAFAQTRLSILDRMNLMIGLRGENDDAFGFSFVPQGTLTYRINKNTLLKSSIGASVRNPDYTERFVSFLIPDLGPNRNAGNPDLKPETSLSTDVGMDWRPSDALHISSSVFARQSSNLIDYIQTNSNQITNLTNLQADTTYFYATNVSETQTLGFETGITYTTFKSDSTLLRFRLDYTYINTSTPEGSVSKYIANHPIQSISPQITFRYNRFRVSTTANLVTRNAEEIPSINGLVQSEYFLLNARVSYKPPVVPARVFIEARNILDTQYQEILGAQMPGRWIYGGLVWRWGDKLNP
ncbi:MAG: TonB-dependent receptor [Bacteroidia bacterium]|nr:TonB-dependent receptor [Bacteroidia bacterium]